MNSLEIFNLDLSSGKNLPKNIYATNVLNCDDNSTFQIIIGHDGYCPSITTDHELSNYSEYLCNLQYELIDNYFKLNKTKKPKTYYSICEIVTNSSGELHHYSKSVNS